MRPHPFQESFMKCLPTAALIAALIAPAFAGDKSCGQISGYRCDNMCPLATTANSHRAYGLEAVSASKFARADVASRVEANLARV
jgi:hypothetical protein